MSNSARSSKGKPTTGLPVEKLVREELLTSKGTSRFDDAMISAMFGISSALGSISKGLEVLQEKTGHIAARMETLEREVNRPRRLQQSALEMTSPPNFVEWSLEDMQALMNSPMPTPGPGTSVDITCYETLSPLCDPLTGRTFL